MQANATINQSADTSPPPRECRAHGVPGKSATRAIFRAAGVPASVAVWIGVVAIGLAALTVGALVLDHNQTTQHLRVTGAP